LLPIVLKAKRLRMKNKYLYFFLVLYAIVATCTIIFLDGTSDAGDSIHHYQFARYAPEHPELFFNHWAKPLYVLLACPFAQFGFVGTKVFNVLVALLTIFFTYRITETLGLKNTPLVIVMLLFSPLHYIITFSGLTEPLFALFCVIALYLVLKYHFMAASIIISFLPFIRSEGLIILGVFGFYFLLKRQWKYLPLFLMGHIVYAIAGYFVYHDFLWVFNKIPYARLSSTYGNGTLLHFVESLIYAFGVPIYVLFWIGVIAIIVQSFKKRIQLEIQVLVFLLFFAFFIAHTLFWYLGIFNSMGLIRVFVGVMPISSIIALIGFNFITEEIFIIKHLPKLIFQGLILSYVLIFPFTINPAAINWKKDMCLSKDQELAKEVALLINQDSKSQHRFIFAHPYLAEALNIDWFNKNQHIDFMNDNLSHLQAGDIVIWENWFSVVEQGVVKTQLDQQPDLIQLYTRKATENNREVEYAVYQKR
jgi:hypothetical protein